MQREALLLAIRPVFAEQIVAGTKTAELRRVRPDVSPGQSVLVYSSSPEMALVASAAVDRVDSDAPNALWRSVRNHAGVSRAQYDAYFDGAERASAIWLTDVTPLARAIPLREIRERWPWFRAPQSYCFVRVAFGGHSGELRSLAPRG